jgi:protein SMG7
MERSRSCQYLLSFQVRVAVVLFRLVNAVTKEDVTAAASHEQETGERMTEISAPLRKLLPLARIYIAWVYVSRASLIQYQEWLEPHIRELHHLLAECLTLLLPHAIVNEEVTESKYLLVEDTEALGIRPFSERKLPLFLDVQIAPDITPPKCRKTLKPRKTALDFECSSQVEAIWRIRDIVCCGIYLAGSSTSPLTTITTNEGIDAWAYDQDRTVPARFDEKSVTRILGRLKMSAHKALTLDDELTGPKSGEADRASAQPEPQPTTLPPYLAGFEDQSKNPPLAQPNITAQPANDGLGLDDDFSADSEMVNMVNKLIDDEDEEGQQPLHQPGRHSVDPSYGMDSLVANEIFGNSMPNSGPPAPGKTATPAALNGKSIPSLPWNYFYSPYASSTTGNGYNVPRTMGAQMGGIGGGSTVDQNSKYPSYNSLIPQIGYPQTHGNRRVSQRGQGLTASSTGVPSGPNSPNFSADQRNSALDNLKAALYAQYGPVSTGAMQSPGYAYVQPAANKQTDAPRAGAQSHRARASTSSISLEYQNSPSPSKLGQHESLSLGLTDLQLGRLQNGQATQSPVSGTGAFGKGAQLSPSMTSPASNGYDFKHSGIQGMPPRGNMGSSVSPFSQMPSLHASDSALAFSNTSSLWAGTPAAADAPRGTIGCNGNFFNASTPFGRSGSINNRDDPTHFRNRLKELGAGVTESVAAYDRTVLESALAEDAGKRTGRQ